MKKVITFLLAIILTISAITIAESDGRLYIPTYKTFMKQYIARLEKDFDAIDFQYKSTVINSLTKLSELRYEHDKNSHYDARDIESLIFTVDEVDGYLDGLLIDVPFNRYYNFMIESRYSFFLFMVEHAIRALHEEWDTSEILRSLRANEIITMKDTNDSESIYVGVYTFRLMRISGHYYFGIDLGYK